MHSSLLQPGTLHTHLAGRCLQQQQHQLLTSGFLAPTPPHRTTCGTCGSKLSRRLRQQASYLLLLGAAERAGERHLPANDQVAPAAWLLADGHALAPAAGAAHITRSAAAAAGPRRIGARPGHRPMLPGPPPASSWFMARLRRPHNQRARCTPARGAGTVPCAQLRAPSCVCAPLRAARDTHAILLCDPGWMIWSCVDTCSVRSSSVCTANCVPHSASASVMRFVSTRSSPSRLHV